jgi:hypothetical protein
LSGSPRGRLATRQPPPESPAEELPHVTDQQIGCFHGGEVAATAEFGPVHDVVGAFGEAADGG